MISTVFYENHFTKYSTCISIILKKRNNLENVAFLCVNTEFSFSKKKKKKNYHLFTHKHAFCNLHFIFDPPPVKLDPPSK